MYTSTCYIDAQFAVNMYERDNENYNPVKGIRTEQEIRVKIVVSMKHPSPYKT